MYIYTFLLRMTDTMSSQNIDLSSWNILYIETLTVPTCGRDYELGMMKKELLWTILQWVALCLACVEEESTGLPRLEVQGDGILCADDRTPSCSAQVVGQIFGTPERRFWWSLIWKKRWRNWVQLVEVRAGIVRRLTAFLVQLPY
jgi:hypothetical protein